MSSNVLYIINNDYQINDMALVTDSVIDTNGNMPQYVKIDPNTISITVNCDRNGNSDTAKIFNSWSNTEGFCTTGIGGGKPDKLNFCFAYDLYISTGNNGERSGPFRINFGQGNSGSTNNWWMNSPLGSGHAVQIGPATSAGKPCILFGQTADGIGGTVANKFTTSETYLFF